MSARTPITCLVCLVGSTLVAGLDTGQQQAGRADPIVGLDAPEPAQRRAAVGRLVETATRPRTQAIDQLVAVVRGNPQKSDVEVFAPKALALEALGRLSADEALPVLVGQVTYRAQEAVWEDVPWAGMPAVGALVRIGFPSVKYILRRDVLEEASSEQLARFALVIRNVFPDGKTARTFVEAYDPGYPEPARTKKAELRKLVAELP